MRVAYVRVSTAEQNEARQIEALEGCRIERYFTEKISGKTADRPELKAMMDFVREGDTVYVLDFSRLARSTKDLLNIIETLNAKGVHLISKKEQLDTSTPTGKLMVTVIGAINEFELENIRERQREGIALAKQRGVYKGRSKKVLDARLWNENFGRYNRREISKSEFAENIGVSRPTLNRLLEREKDGTLKLK